MPMNNLIMTGRQIDSQSRLILYFNLNLIISYCNIVTPMPGLKITVGHWKLADQNLLMSDENPQMFGHYVQRFLA